MPPDGVGGDRVYHRPRSTFFDEREGNMSKNTIKTYVLLAAIGALFLVIGEVLGGSGGLTIGLILGLVMVGGSYWFSDSIAIKAARAVPVSEAQMPDYYAIVRELTQ